MSSPVAFLILAAAAVPPNVTFGNSAPPQPALVLPPQSVPPPAMQPPHTVSGPQERGSTQSYISRDDYPAEAVGTRAQGTVRFTLTIGPDGRVIGCAISQSSGSEVLDRATCNIISRRARYTPARDSNGNPVAGTIDQQIVWKLP